MYGKSSDWTASFYPEAGERFFEQRGVYGEAAAVGFDVFEFVEGAEQAELDGGVLFGVVQRAAVSLAPGGNRAFGQEDADRIRDLAVRGDVAGTSASSGKAARLPTK